MRPLEPSMDKILLSGISVPSTSPLTMHEPSSRTCQDACTHLPRRTVRESRYSKVLPKRCSGSQERFLQNAQRVQSRKSINVMMLFCLLPCLHSRHARPVPRCSLYARACLGGILPPCGQLQRRKLPVRRSSVDTDPSDGWEAPAEKYDNTTSGDVFWAATTNTSIFYPTDDGKFILKGKWRRLSR